MQERSGIYDIPYFSMITTILFIAGRILYGGFFIMSGIHHFKNMEGLTGYAASKNIPAPGFAVAISGFFILLGGAGVLLGVYAKWALVLIALFLIPVTFTMHAYWKDTDGTMKMANRVNFMKNLALLGATFLLLSIPRPWPYSFF